MESLGHHVAGRIRGIPDSVVGLAGVAAFLAAVLACRPEFSPDGRKLAIVIPDRERKGVAVHLVDLAKGSFAPVFHRVSPGDPLFAVPIWADAGRSLVVCSTDGSGEGDGKDQRGNLLVSVVPVEPGGPMRLLSVPGNFDAGLALYPPRLLGQNLFLGAGRGVIRLGLRDGSLTEIRLGVDAGATAEAPVLLLGEGESLYYAQARTGGYELGSLDPETMRSTVLLRRPEGELGGAAVGPGGRWAIAEKMGHGHRVRFHGGGAPVGSVSFGSAEAPAYLGNMVWSPVGSRLLAAYAESPGTNRVTLGYCEIEPGGGSVRRVPLEERRGEDPGQRVMGLLVNVSRDGKWLAASTGWLDGSREEPEAVGFLYLVDLRRPDRRATRLPLPAWKTP